MPHLDEPTPAYERTQAAGADQQTLSAALSGTAAPAGYDLREEIGRGGMGLVYRALDLSLNREVAVKLLQDQFAAVGTTAARFLDEARITAQLQHPGIPAVHQVGMMPNGRPFLAMKLIKGETLDRLLKARPDPAAERGHFLQIFEAIAQALGYAHSRRVIHRDLKPANVMVGAFGETQVMDWGLAKVLGETAIQRSDSDETTKIRSDRDSNSDASTQYGQFMGTPAFMPPEQAIGAVDRIDERSDVFGLGAILCVILTGKPPFVGSDAETTRQLAARGKVEEAFSRLDACGADPELIALTKRCLAVEPADRPTNAGELAAALAAYRTGAEERVRRTELARAAGDARRRTTTRAAVALVAVLGAGVAAATWQAIRATDAEANTARQLKLTQDAEAKEREAREEADRQKAQAIEDRETARKQERIADERRLDSVRQQLKTETVMQFLLGVLGQSNPWDQIDAGHKADPNLTIREALDRSAKKMDARYTDSREIEARIREAVGTAYYGIGLYAEAEKHLRRAIERLTDDYSTVDLDRDGITLSLANSLSKQGKFAEAEPLFTRILAARQAASGPDNLVTLRVLENHAGMRLAEGKPAEAEAMLRRVATTLDKTHGPDAQVTLTAWMQVADCLRPQDRNAEAVPIYDRVLAGLVKLNGEDHPSTLFAVNNLALVHEELGNAEKAEVLYRRAIAGLERRFGPDHDETLIAQLNLASLLRNYGRLDVAEKLATDIYDRRMKLFGPKFPNTLFAANQLALILKDRGQADRAEPLMKRAIAGLAEVMGESHPETAECRSNLAELYRMQDRLAEAEPLYLAVVAGREKHFGPDHTKTMHALNNLGTLREAQGRYAEAEALFRRVIAAHEKTLGPKHRETLMSQFNLGYVFMSQNRNADAEPWLRKSYEGRRETLGDDNLQTQFSLNWLVMALESQEKFAQAEPLLRRILAIRERQDKTSWLTANTRSRLGRAVLAYQDYDEARKLLEPAFEELKAKSNQIHPMWRGIRLREAAGRVALLHELSGRAEDAARWRAIESQYREQAPAARVR
ncbi:MAG: serine/threonine protein kinase [Gemmataceae bacterium]|nr:serine/threonine protein kinase [Gemmataceae bacterium]